MMNLGCPSSFYNRMYKIVEESLDATLYVCNNNLERFTVAKIFDVFDQTFPTAFILSTGYWIFFVSNYGAPLCVCGRFGIICRHVRSRSHWIDLQPIAERSENVVFTPKIHGAVKPSKYNISIDNSSECSGYLISINMDLIHTKIKKEIHVDIRASYGYVYPCYGALFSIKFTPNPLLKRNYGKYLEKLKIHRGISLNRPVDDLIVTPYNMPSTGLLLVSVNLMKYNMPTKVSAVPLAEWEKTESDFRLKDVATQTTISNEEELNKNALENFTSSIWQYKEQEDSQSRIRRHFLAAIPYRNFERSFPLGIHDSEQYDQQFPDMKIKSNIKTQIKDDSIPEPVTTASIQVNIKQSKCKKIPSIDKTQLPNFKETFQTPRNNKRRRERPKVYRCDVSKSFSMVVKNASISRLDSMSSASSENLTISSIEQVHSSSEEERFMTTAIMDAQSLAEFDEIVKQVNEKCKFFGDEDYESELDLINQLITEKMHNDLARL